MAQAKVWQELKRKVVFHKYAHTIERRDYRLPDGTIGDYYIHLAAPGACALAITKDNKIVMLPQYRPGRGRVLHELPGGFVEAGEHPRAAALRELAEETGYSGDAEEWTGTWWIDAYAQVKNAVVIVRNCTRVAEPTLDEREFGEVELVDIADFVAQVRAGELTDTTGAMLALDHLGWLK